MYSTTNINVLESIYVVGQNKEQKKHKKKLNSKTNEMALIMRCIIKFCPEIVNSMNENKFILMQGEILKILRKCETENRR